jgi:hypothetical protein
VRIFTVAGVLSAWDGPTGDRGLATATPISPPGVVAADSSGGFLVVEGDTVERIGLDGLTTRVAGSGGAQPSGGFGGDGGLAMAALLNGPEGVAALPGGGFLIADSGNNRVREVAPDGVISTVAGNGQAGFSGDGGPAVSATLNSPQSVAPTPRGGFLIADSRNNRVRRVWPDGHITTVAGDGVHGSGGDGGAAVAAELNRPDSVAALRDGGLLIADTSANRIRRVWPDGRISTVAGTGRRGSSGDGGPAIMARLDSPQAVAALPDGGFLIADAANNRVRRVFRDGRIGTIAGDETDPSSQDFSDFSDGGDATRSPLNFPVSLAVLPDSSVLVGEGDSVRMLVTRGHPVRRLAVAIRPLLGSASQSGYRMRFVLTTAARVRATLYRTGLYGVVHRRPILASAATPGAGEGNLDFRFERGFRPDVYAVDLRATAGPQTTRTGAFAYLGGRLTLSSVLSLQSTMAAEVRFRAATKPAATLASSSPYPGSCLQFGPARVDCEWDLSECVWIEASFLDRTGQIYDRTYDCGQRGGFKRRPHWTSGRSWVDLGSFFS